MLHNSYDVLCQCRGIGVCSTPTKVLVRRNVQHLAVKYLEAKIGSDPPKYRILLKCCSKQASSGERAEQQKAFELYVVKGFASSDSSAP